MPRVRRYMAGLMTAPMVVIELIVMRAIRDVEIRELCRSLAAPQQAEINQMEAKLQGLG